MRISLGPQLHAMRPTHACNICMQLPVQALCLPMDPARRYAGMAESRVETGLCCLQVY